MQLITKFREYFRSLYSSSCISTQMLETKGEKKIDVLISCSNRQKIEQIRDINKFQSRHVHVLAWKRDFSVWFRITIRSRLFHVNLTVI